MTDDRDHEHHHDHEHEHDHHEHQLGYEDSIALYRAQKDAYFKTGRGSPIPEAERPTFEGLPYYPVDPSLRLEGLLPEPYAGNEPSNFQIPTSDGKLRSAHRAGILTFDIAGAAQKLTAYTFEGDEDDSLFVPFLDATSGTESYGAGRYLDLDPEEDGTYTLDFNLAYHPSCVYDPKFSCPLTPAENRLAMRIEAGERLAAAATAG